MLLYACSGDFVNVRQVKESQQYQFKFFTQKMGKEVRSLRKSLRYQPLWKAKEITLKAEIF
jgi:hypothetical protein